MREYTTVEVEDIVREQMQSDLEQLLREGARQMLAVALREEVDEYIKQHQEERDEHDRRRVVRNGSHPPRELVTGVGKVACGSHGSTTGERERVSPALFYPGMRGEPPASTP